MISPNTYGYKTNTSVNPRFVASSLYIFPSRGDVKHLYILNQKLISLSSYTTCMLFAILKINLNISYEIRPPNVYYKA
jgi:hypothetical protein